MLAANQAIVPSAVINPLGVGKIFEQAGFFTVSTDMPPLSVMATCGNYPFVDHGSQTQFQNITELPARVLPTFFANAGSADDSGDAAGHISPPAAPPSAPPPAPPPGGRSGNNLSVQDYNQAAKARVMALPHPNQEPGDLLLETLSRYAVIGNNIGPYRTLRVGDELAAQLNVSGDGTSLELSGTTDGVWRFIEKTRPDLLPYREEIIHLLELTATGRFQQILREAPGALWTLFEDPYPNRKELPFFVRGPVPQEGLEYEVLEVRWDFLTQLCSAQHLEIKDYIDIQRQKLAQSLGLNEQAIARTQVLSRVLLEKYPGPMESILAGWPNLSWDGVGIEQDQILLYPEYGTPNRTDGKKPMHAKAMLSQSWAGSGKEPIVSLHIAILERDEVLLKRLAEGLNAIFSETSESTGTPAASLLERATDLRQQISDGKILKDSLAEYVNSYGELLGMLQQQEFTQEMAAFLGLVAHDDPEIRKRIVSFLFSLENPEFAAKLATGEISNVVRILGHQLLFDEPESIVRGAIANTLQNLAYHPNFTAQEALEIAMELLPIIKNSGAKRVRQNGSAMILMLADRLPNKNADTEKIADAMKELFNDPEEDVASTAKRVYDALLSKLSN